MVRCRRSQLAHTHTLGDEATDAPVVFTIVVVVLLRLFEVLQEVEVLALCFGILLGLKALAHRLGDDFDIALQDFDAGEDVVIDTLQNPAWGAFTVRDDVGVVDVTVAKGLHLSDFGCRDELTDDVLHIRISR